MPRGNGKRWIWAALTVISSFGPPSSAWGAVVAIPAPSEPLVPVPAPPPSRIVVGLKVPLETVRSSVDSQIPPSWAEWDAWIRPPNACLKYQFNRGPISMSLAPGTAWHIDANVPGHLDLEACYSVNNHMCGPCASCSPDVDFPLSADVALSPDWRLDIALHNGGARVRPCNIPIWNNVSGHIADQVNPRIDAALESASATAQNAANFKPQGQALWDLVSGPIRLADGVWLLMHPESVWAQPNVLPLPYVAVTVGLDAHPEIVLGPQPAVTPGPLPPLQMGAGDGDFSVPIDIVETFANLSPILAGQIVGLKYTVGDKDLTIVGASVGGAGSEAVIRVDVQGAVQGSLYLTGAPAYDPAKDVLAADVDFTAATRGALAASAPWVLSTSLAQDVNDKVAWRTGNDVASIRDQLKAALNGSYGPIKMMGRVSQPSVLGVYVESDAFLIRAMVHGRVTAGFP
jgi:hypothetical protein